MSAVKAGWALPVPCSARASAEPKKTPSNRLDPRRATTPARERPSQMVAGTSRLGEPGRIDFLVAHLDAARVVVRGNHQQGIAAGREGDIGGEQRAAGF